LSVRVLAQLFEIEEEVDASSSIAIPHPQITMSVQQSLEVAKSLPPRLLRFFQRYPPPALFPHLATTSSPTLPAAPDATTTISTTPPTDTNAATNESSAPDAILVPSTAPSNSRIPPEAHDLPYPNPFLPHKNFTTGRWRSPVYGLRKQADLVKLAGQYGVVDLLPWTSKKPGEKERRRIERGLEVKGTGEGQRVKGKLWERTMKGRLEMRRQAMLNMPAMIQEWKQKGHGRGWKKWPSGKAK
jgi:large subunit ribosomal protein L25